MLVPLNGVKSSSEFLLTVPRRCFYCGSFLLFMIPVCLRYIDLSVSCSLVIICWGRTDLLAFMYVMFPFVWSRYYMVSWVGCST